MTAADVVLGVLILAVAAFAVLALCDVRDRDPVRPVPRRDLEHYDDDGRDDRLAP